jgi:3-hydroxyisobutyrate dehydrogenase-like beta-hydroxyacid dehydrogenase
MTRWTWSGPCWRPMATRSCTSARVGAGQRVKLVNNALFAAQIGLVADAVRLGAQLGADLGAPGDQAASLAG